MEYGLVCPLKDGSAEVSGNVLLAEYITKLVLLPQLIYHHFLTGK